MQEEADANDKKEYEIAYVAAAEDGAAAVEKGLAAHGCAISGKGTLAAIKLAHPIKKHTSGFFGYYWFTAMPEDVKKVHDALMLQQNVLRFLITTPPVKVTVRENRMPRERSAQPKPTIGAPTVKPIEVAPITPAPEVLSNELLEKKLEEILK